MSTFTLSLLRADDPKMSSARLFASSVYLERHDAANTTPPDWTILLEEQGVPCASFSVFDPATHSPLFFSRLFEKEWEMLSKRAGRVAEAGALAVARSDNRIFTTHAPIILAGALFLGMRYMGYSSFVCVVNRLVTRLTKNVGASCVSYGQANPELLPDEMASAMKGYFAAGPCGYEVGKRVDPSILNSSFLGSTSLLGVDCSGFAPLHVKAA